MKFVEKLQQDAGGEFIPAGFDFPGWDELEPSPDNVCGWIDRRTDKIVFVLDSDGCFVLTPCGEDSDLRLVVKAGVSM